MDGIAVSRCRIIRLLLTQTVHGVSNEKTACESLVRKQRRDQLLSNESVPRIAQIVPTVSSIKSHVLTTPKSSDHPSRERTVPQGPAAQHQLTGNRKLNSLEHRAKCLERALLAAKPDADVTAITSGDASDSCGPSLQNLQTATRNAEKGRTESHVGIETPDQLPPTSSGFEWDEGTSPDARPADGMGTLSFPDHGVGYIGEENPAV